MTRSLLNAIDPRYAAAIEAELFTRGTCVGCQRSFTRRVNGAVHQHYRASLLGGRLLCEGSGLPPVEGSFNGGACLLEGCNDQRGSKYWCSRHYRRWHQHGNAGHWKGARSAEDHPNWRGGKTIRGRYIYVSLPHDHWLHEGAIQSGPYRRQIAEQRLVMATALGRPLEDHETVHHINGETQDNRLENLQLRQGRHGKGVVRQCQDCGSHNVIAVEL